MSYGLERHRESIIVVVQSNEFELVQELRMNSVNKMFLLMLAWEEILRLKLRNSDAANGERLKELLDKLNAQQV